MLLRVQRHGTAAQGLPVMHGDVRFSVRIPPDHGSVFGVLVVLAPSHGQPSFGIHDRTDDLLARLVLRTFVRAGRHVQKGVFAGRSGRIRFHQSLERAVQPGRFVGYAGAVKVNFLVRHGWYLL